MFGIKRIRGISGKLAAIVTGIILIALIIEGCHSSRRMEYSDQSPPVKNKEVLAVGDSEAEFAYVLYKSLRKTKGNLFFSPSAIYDTLVMAYAGSVDDIMEEVGDVLGLSLPDDRLIPVMNEYGENIGDRDYFEIDHAFWKMPGFVATQIFSDAARDLYGIDLWTLDLRDEPDTDRDLINKWVDTCTRGKIPAALEKAISGPEKSGFIASAVWADLDWHWPFVMSSTTDAEFKPPDGETVTVQQMQECGHYNYTLGDGYQAMEIPCRNTDDTMLLILPDPGAFEIIDAKIDGDFIKSIIAGQVEAQVELKLPKFEIRSSLFLKEILVDTGIPAELFKAGPERNQLRNESGIRLMDNLHCAYLNIEEKTRNEMINDHFTYSGIDAEFIVDRPFIFIIRNIPTGAVMFMGRVINPLEG